MFLQVQSPIKNYQLKAGDPVKALISPKKTVYGILKAIGSTNSQLELNTGLEITLDNHKIY